MRRQLAMSKLLVMTFDYELFLGTSSGSVKKSLIEPVNEILSVLNEGNAKGIFFIDAAFLLVLKKNKHASLIEISDQIRRIVKCGNDVGLHIHPQWLDAYERNDETWGFRSYDRYRIHSLNKEELLKLISDGKSLIEEIVNAVKPGYRIRAFRAGGWCVQPFLHISEALYENGITFDFSVKPGMSKTELKNRFYDFSNVEKGRSFWRFSNDPCIEDKTGRFIEIPLSTYCVRGYKLLLNKLSMFGSGVGGDGMAVGVDNGFTNNFARLFKTETRPLSMDYTSMTMFKSGLNAINSKLILCIQHPKIFNSKARKLLKYAVSNYGTIGLAEIDHYCSSELNKLNIINSCKVMILSYTFPPAPGVGARRWAKFAKCLVKAGYQVYVISADWNDRNCRSNWSDDVNNIEIYRIRGGLNPNLLFGNVGSKIWRKIKWLFGQFLIRMMTRLFGWIDYAEGWGRHMLPAARSIIDRNNITNVIATGAPFSVNYFASFLRTTHPHLNIIQDFRDPWNYHIKYSYPENIKKVHLKNKHLLCEKITHLFSNKIVNVSRELSDVALKIFGEGYVDKYKIIHNGYDIEDYPSVQSHSKQCDKLKIVYVGSLGGGRVEAIVLIDEIMLELGKNDPFWKDQCEVLICGAEKIVTKSGNIIFEKYLGMTEVAEQLSKAHIGLMINSKVNTLSFGTKLFDYFYAGLPILLVSCNCDLTELVKERGLGFVSSYQKEDLKKCLYEIKKCFKRSHFGDFDKKTMSEFSIENLTQEYIKMLV